LQVKSIVLEEKEVFVCKTATEDLTPGEGEAIVRVGAVGCCGTDYHAYGGNQALFSYPRIIGACY
jgi:threonine dehydrogenase-like Zn-dependent dehydrogenase